MVARDGVEPPTRGFSARFAVLPKYSNSYSYLSYKVITDYFTDYSYNFLAVLKYDAFFMLTKC